jgi:ATP adenylyltransferase/5',5'''-P-1,P-4-tetraphosphate phosphorylase II
MEALEFINKYENYIEEIGSVIKPEYQLILDKMKDIDPHDLVVPDSWFVSERAARGYVWSMFIRRVKLSNMRK